jgi:flagellar hook-associated protein 3 FlgL
MRVTDNMITNRSLFNLQRSIQRYMQLQTDMSSGRRINAPSDDPTGTVKDLTYRKQLANVEQYQKNIAVAQNWTSTYDSILNEVNGFASSAKEIAVAMSNGTYDATARAASASEVQSLFDQMMQMGNSELEGRRIFAGFQTKTKPFTATGTGVVFAGDMGELQFDIEASQKLTININGADVFLKQFAALGAKSDLDVGLTNATLLTELKGGAGLNLVPGTFTVADRNHGINVTVDLTTAPPATTVGDVIGKINAQLTAGGISNLTARIDPAGNSLGLVTTRDDFISGNTLLTNLNSGTGVSLTPGKIHVGNGGAYSFDVDLSGSLTVNDVITKFNNAMTAAGVANVSMSVNAANNGLQITDTNAVPVGLTITEASTLTSTGSNLGILGSVGAQLVGSNLRAMVDFAIGETTGTTARDIGLFGQVSHDFVGTDLNPSLSLNSLMTSLKSGNGIDRKSIVIHQGNASATVDLSDPTIVTVQDLIDKINTSGLTVTASLNAAHTGIQIVNDDPKKSLSIEESSNGRTAKDLGIYGSSDLMGSMLVLINALKNNDQEGTSIILGSLDDGMQHVLNARGAVGARGVRLSSTDSRLTDMNLNFTKLLSDTEDADFTKTVTDLATYENNYQAALSATARIIQPSLLNFLK